MTGGTGYDNGVKNVTGTTYLMDEETPQGNISETGKNNVLEIGEISEQASLNGNTYLHDNGNINNGNIESSKKLPMVNIDDQQNIQVNRSGHNIGAVNVKEMAMEKRSMKKGSEMEHGDRSADYSITDDNSNNLSFDVGNKDVELSMEKAVNTVLKIKAEINDTTLKVVAIYEKTKLSNTQENLLLTVLDKTIQLGKLFMTELDSVQRNGVWNNTISDKLRKVLEE